MHSVTKGKHRNGDGGDGDGDDAAALVHKVSATTSRRAIQLPLLDYFNRKRVQSLIVNLKMDTKERDKSDAIDCQLTATIIRQLSWSVKQLSLRLPTSSKA